MASGVETVTLGAPLLWLAVAAPIAAGIVSGFTGRSISAKGHTMLATLSWLVSLLLLLPALGHALAGRVVVDPVYGEVPGLGVFALFMDAVSAILALSIVLVSLTIAVYSRPYMEHRFEELGGGSWGTYFLLYQLFTAGMLGAVLASNTVLFYLFLELTLIPSGLLIALYGYGDRLRVALLYLVWTHVGTLLYLLGIFISGAYDIYVPGTGYAVAAFTGLLPLALIVVGLGVKMAMAGIHFWLPYAHAEAPTPVSALLSPLFIGVGGYALFRVGVGMFQADWATLRPVLFAWAVATMLYGGFLVLVQQDVKRLFAYSSISQMGYIMLGLSVANPEAEAGAILHYMSHALGKAILFGVAGVFIVALGTRNIREMGGLLGVMPYTGSIALTGFMLISGLPPTLGMWSEVLLVFGYAKWAMDLGLGLFLLTAALIAAAMTLTVVYSFQTFRLIFLGRRGSAAERGGESHASSLIAPLLVLAVLGVALFVAAGVLVDPLVDFLRVVYG